jgi:signal peptidase II
MTTGSKLGKLPVLAYGIAIVVIAVDQASKYWVLHGLDLPLRQHIEVWPPIFNLTMVWNRGVSFGLFRSPEGQETIRWLLAAFAAVVSVALILWVRKARRAWSAVSVGLIIGGAIGNLIDRVRLGAVADFLDFSGLKFIWIFNIADSAITVGVILLLLETFLTAEKDKTPL